MTELFEVLRTMLEYPTSAFFLGIGCGAVIQCIITVVIIERRL